MAALGKTKHYRYYEMCIMFCGFSFDCVFIVVFCTWDMCHCYLTMYLCTFYEKYQKQRLGKKIFPL